MRYLLLILFFTIQTFGFGANAIDLQKSNVEKELTSKKSNLEERKYKEFRYYSPDSGTYISQDPIGLFSGEMNLYSYVNDSNTWIDPFGLLGAEALAAAQKMGANAEVIAQNKYGFAKNTEWVDSIKEGRYHIPDGMTNTDIYEVKCVKKQGYTRQIKSFVDTGKNVTVIVDTDTKLSKVLKQAELDGKLKIERTDLKNRPKKISCG